MARVYLETSFISACVTHRTDPASLYRKSASLEWWDKQRARHVLYISDEVFVELSHNLYPHRDAARAFVSGIPLLHLTDDVVGFAELLVKEKVMPGPVAGDALHVAISTVHQVEYLLSWNVRHLANPNKIEHPSRICVRAGMLPPRIITPDLLWEMDDE